MIRPVDKKSVGWKGRDSLRQALAAPAWRLWTALARNDVMADSDNRDSMMERHKIVVALIEVNSQQLRCDSASAGLDIERLYAVRECERLGDTAEARAALDEIARRAGELDEKKKKLNQERNWLERSLSEFDAAMANSPRPPKIHN